MLPIFFEDYSRIEHGGTSSMKEYKTEIDENWDEKFSIYLTINIYLKVLEK